MSEDGSKEEGVLPPFHRVVLQSLRGEGESASHAFALGISPAHFFALRVADLRYCHLPKNAQDEVLLAVRDLAIQHSRSPLVLAECVITMIHLSGGNVAGAQKLASQTFGKGEEGSSLWRVRQAIERWIKQEEEVEPEPAKV